ncbi:multiple sugar transport system ATP-binding protein [Micrococcus cohnii]|uniref:Multiple sugar transport system ATP-binding protein n=1 Tax=Micrococcus cohnii TaxID=993416 RepID=A0A7W7GPM5_9MICC|nr:ABC transporter ATP-binding protein [Micrococcus cohnii]MBB4735988.1 multiple sugar transport system ATP-binding protein [Micrococcus cohnii]
MATVEYRQASRMYDLTRPPAVNRLSLKIEDGEFLVLVGPSGSGKSTAMRMLAGLEPVDEGQILIDGKDVTELRARDRDVSMVFQSYALYPNMTARQNIAFALENIKTPKAQIKEKVAQAAAMLELEDLLDKKPSQMSGGQRQRVAMGRSIVRDPKVWCMDEPLSNLDAKLRVSTRAQIAALQRELGVTTVYVTHDQTEAMTMGDRVAVLKDGVLQQVDTPTHLYSHPGNTFVATFIGSPAVTLVEDVVVSDGRAGLGPGPSVHFGMPSDLMAKLPGDSVIAGVRPENWEIVAVGEQAPEGVEALAFQVQFVENLGSEAFLYAEPQLTGDSRVRIHRNRVAIKVSSAEGFEPGTVLHALPRPGKAMFFHPESRINLEYL